MIIICANLFQNPTRHDRIWTIPTLYEFSSVALAFELAVWILKASSCHIWRPIGQNYKPDTNTIMKTKFKKELWPWPLNKQHSLTQIIRYCNHFGKFKIHDKVTDQIGITRIHKVQVSNLLNSMRLVHVMILWYIFFSSYFKTQPGITKLPTYQHILATGLTTAKV